MNPPPPNFAAPAPHPKTSGLAVASLVLGILGFCTGVTGIAAVICGHMALSRIKKAAGTLTGSGLAIGGLATGYITGIFGVILLAGMVAGMIGAVDRQNQSGTPFDNTSITAPPFPDLPAEFTVLEPSGVRVAQLETSAPGSDPGTEMQLRVYLPAGDHPAHSLSCVLVAPAGTTLLTGAGIGSLTEDPYHDETLPYAEAGMAVVFYSIDGETDPDLDETTASITAYNQFRAAGAGTVNGRNALGFALAKLPMVDPGRIYSAGHSSAGTLSLLLASHEPRLAGSLAYCPAFDLETHFAEFIADPFIGLTYHEFALFARRSSPLTHVDHLSKPLFLFFAEDDSMIDFPTAREFADGASLANPATTFESAGSGGHYRSMISQGIPAGIRWIRSLENRNH